MLAHYARAVTLMGAAGAGQLTKMVNQICVAGRCAGTRRRTQLRAARRDSTPLRVLDVISKGAAQSWQMENRGKTMVADKFDFGFAVDWMRKDLEHLPRGGAHQRRGAAGDRADRSVLFARSRRGRRPLGYVEPDPVAARRASLTPAARSIDAIAFDDRHFVA